MDFTEAHRPPLVLYPFTGDRVGGSYFSAAVAARHLVRLGLADVVGAFPSGAPTTEPFLGTGARILFYDSSEADLRAIQNQSGLVPKLRSLPAQARVFLSARRVIREVEPDLVHVNDDRSLFPWALAARIEGVPVVWHVRQRGPNVLLDPIRTALADWRIFIAADGLSRFPSATGSERRTVVHNAIDPDVFAPLPGEDRARERSAWGFPEDRVIVAFISNVVPRKRPEWFLRAVADLTRSGRRVFGVFAGGSPRDPAYLERLRQEYRELVDQRSLVFLGPIDDVASCLNAVDVLVLPSAAEPFGRILAEAMACGVPPVAGRGGGALEVVEHEGSGLLFDPDSYEDMYECIRRLVDDDELRASLGDQGVPRSVRMFGPTAAATSIAEVYRKVTLGAGSGRA